MVEREIYTADFAKVLSVDVGQKWRPSNGTEGEMFQSNYCSDCDRWDEETGCPIAAATFSLDKGDPEYPQEWQIGSDGQPTCSAFNDPDAADPRQLDMFVARPIGPETVTRDE